MVCAVEGELLLCLERFVARGVYGTHHAVGCAGAGSGTVEEEGFGVVDDDGELWGLLYWVVSSGLDTTCRRERTSSSTLSMAWNPEKKPSLPDPIDSYGMHGKLYSARTTL